MAHRTRLQERCAVHLVDYLAAGESCGDPDHLSQVETPPAARGQGDVLADNQATGQFAIFDHYVGRLGVRVSDAEDRVRFGRLGQAAWPRKTFQASRQDVIGSAATPWSARHRWPRSDRSAGLCRWSARLAPGAELRWPGHYKFLPVDRRKWPDPAWWSRTPAFLGQHGYTLGSRSHRRMSHRRGRLRCRRWSGRVGSCAGHLLHPPASGRAASWP